MRIVHIVTAFPRNESDPITPWLVELVRRQRGLGQEASVLAPAYRGGPPAEAFGIPVRRFRYAPARLETLTHEEAVPDRLRRAPRYAALLPAYLAGGLIGGARVGAGRPDILHVHWPMPHALVGAAARLRSGGRSAVVCSYYSVEVNWVRHRMRWLLPFLRWTMRTADAVTAISTSTAQAVGKIVPRQVAVVPYGTTIGDDEAPVSRPALASPDRPLRLLFVGRLVERKGVAVLMAALAEVRQRRAATLTVVGEGEWGSRLRAMAGELGVAEHVRFTGSVPTETLRREYEAADIFVLPAVVDARGDTEGLGVVLLEALRFERPVVASRIGGIPDIIQDGRSGWLVGPGDAQGLASTLLRVAESPEKAREVAAQGRRMARDRFSWSRILRLTEEVYQAARRGRQGDGGA